MGSNDTAAVAWHALESEEVLRRLDADLERGLSEEEALERLKRHGLNALTPRPGQPAWLRFLLQFHQPLVYILLAAVVVTAALAEWVDSAVILGVVLVNAVVGYLQEHKAVRALEALSRTMTTQALALRGGKTVRLPSVELVPGDVVLVSAGDKTPADLRLARSRELRVDESALTGESLPASKAPAPVAPDAPLADRTGMLYASTLVAAGQGRAVVVGTGDRTEVGRISKLISSAETIETPLTRKIAAFSHILLYAILLLAAATFVAGVLHKQPAGETFLAAVALAVGAIPEGLPAAVTITLAIGVGRMAHRRAIIRKLPAVETLGSTTVICSDKTGTLTENQMTVQKVFAGEKEYDLSGAGYAPEGRILLGDSPAEAASSPALRECLLAGLLCSDSRIVEKEGLWEAEGDPTEAALETSARKGGLGPGDALPRLDALPFESERQYMATLHRSGQGADAVVYLKGSVEQVLRRCSDALGDAGTSPLDRAAVTRRAEESASQGLRVLAFARGRRPPGAAELTHEDVSGGLTFLGLQAMIDPPRREAVRAVAACHGAGIRVKMITGDHALTAAAIAGRLGLRPRPDEPSEEARALSGHELEGLSDARLQEAVEKTSVFARVTPEQKLRLVRALQARGHVAAMTGDGVNDAPALKQADIGVAMGRAGTEVAKEAADMVLTDDNFASIEAAVEEGRCVFDNLRKFIVWTLPTNLGEGLAILAAIFTGTDLPVVPVQILWINMTTAVCLGLTLAFEPREPDIMRRPPRDPRQPIMTAEIAARTVMVGVLLVLGIYWMFIFEKGKGAPIEEARTAAVNVLVIGELFYLFNCRSLTRSMFAIGPLSNRPLLAGVLVMLALQALFTYSPSMNAAFHSAPLPAEAWGRIALFGLGLYLAVGLEKLLRRKMLV